MSRWVHGWTTTAVCALAACALAEPIDAPSAFVAGSDVQPGGPAHDYRIGVFEVRNLDFVAFLNDAKANLTNERGHYLHFDTDTGDVYIAATVNGVANANGSGTLIFDIIDSPYITFDGSTYSVDGNGADHPVVGVSWYGAVKFCNWLTIDSGLPVAQRAYTEATNTNLGGWHPVTISTANWTIRDLNDSERAALVDGYFGYRLPMDDGEETASAFNEWYKAAAWDELVADNHDYGFGRDFDDGISGADANYRCSGDPFEDPFECLIGGTTPVGYYDGTDHGGEFATSADENYYGLRDVSGNVWEWVQDQGFVQADRRNRGGGWSSSTTSMQVAFAADRAASATDATTGFRVVQSLPDVLLVTPQTGLTNSGVWGGPYSAPENVAVTYCLTNTGDEPIEVGLTADANWLIIDPDPAGGPIVIAGGDSAFATVSLDVQCGVDLAIGANDGTLIAENLTTGATVHLPMSLTTTQPLTLQSPVNETVTMVFGQIPVTTLTYTLTSTSQVELSASASLIETTPGSNGIDPPLWLTLDPADSFPIPPLSNESVIASVSPDAGTLQPGTYTAELTLLNNCTGTTFLRTITLVIDAVIDVTPGNELVSTGLLGGPFDPPSHVFTIENLLDAPIDWSVEIAFGDGVAPWLGAAPASGLGLAGQAEAQVTATVLSVANSLEPGQYTATLTFASQGYEVERSVLLDVQGEVLVEPIDAASFAGPLGGPFTPESFAYTIHNTGFGELAWTVTFADTSVPAPGVDWLAFAPAGGTIVQPDGTAIVNVSISEDAAQLPSGVYAGTLEFQLVLTNHDLITVARSVVLDVGGETFSLATVNVPPADVQIGGPEHHFRVGRYEVTNDEYASFLNDAFALAESGVFNGRNDFLYFDTDSGSVYINDQQQASIGTDAPTGSITTMLYNAAVGRITFDGEKFVTAAGFENHPVVGVSWYGAAKFCNWLTLVQEMPPEQRAYLEGPAADDWMAVEADNAQLVASLSGFRLPVDDGATAASPINEWHKAASRKGFDAFGQPVYGSIYGFGRDSLTSADANYLNSNDPFTDTTPIGYFNGINPLNSGLTADTGNGYGLYDFSGNVAEWIHDRTVGGSGVTRGGHFLNAQGSSQLKTDVRSLVAADATLNFIGFRVAQSFTPVALSVIQDAEQMRADGPVGGPLSFDNADGTFTLLLDHAGTYTLDDLTISIDADWLNSVGVLPQQIPSGELLALQLEVDTTALLSVSPEPGEDFTLASVNDAQANGPEYDYWIARREVTNDEFAAFLNDARANPGNQSGAFLYFDIESGNVYINSAETGAEGGAPADESISTLLYDASVGWVEFIDDAYVVADGYGQHPVVGVSWFGAVKYCNWRTLDEGLPAGVRAYAESTDPAQWRPVTIEAIDWLARDLNAGERYDLIRTTVGYRLPMDDGATGASAFNEWYKAASRGPDDEQGEPAFDTIYGFGRDALSGADANFLGSDDPFEAVDCAICDTSPVGYYDGINALIDESLTAETDNGYSLFDVTGNVAEWMQDFFVSDDPSMATTRGGSWSDAGAAAALRNDARTGAAPDEISNEVGFRIVRGTGHVATITITDGITGTTADRHVILDLREPLKLSPGSIWTIAGLYGTNFSTESRLFSLVNESNLAMDWEVTIDQEWVAIDGTFQGTLEGGSQVYVVLAIDAQANDLPPGEYEATAAFTNLTTGVTQSRVVTLNVAQAIDVELLAETAEFSGLWGGPFDDPATISIALTSVVDFDLDYEVSTAANWLDIVAVEPAGELTGPLNGLTSVTFEMSINDAANSLAVGDYDVTVELAFIDPANGVTSSIEQVVTLHVVDPIMITQVADPWQPVVTPGMAALPAQTYSLSNNGTSPIDVLITVTYDDDVAPWLTVSDLAPFLLAGAQGSVDVSVNDAVDQLVDGQYTATIGFADQLTGHVEERVVELTISETISVSPFTSLESYGAVGQQVDPSAAVYVVSNFTDDGSAIDWQVSASEPWVLFNGQAVVGGTLAGGQSQSIVVSILTASPQLVEGTHEAIITFADLTNVGAAVLTRAVTVHLEEPEFAVERKLVPGGSAQPLGPTYSFELAQFLTTNEKFVVFLNDAMNRLDDERGQYMYFDTDTGDVYINDQIGGEVGVDGSGTLMFSPVVGGDIEFDGIQYTVIDMDRATHPVAGVTWYGAVKFCNWLTLDQGISPQNRCYTEDVSTNLSGWHPITITTADWSVRGLNAAERFDLVQLYRGYRLPMDNMTTSASLYNEWYKAAAWDPADLLNHVYGFGRDTISGADANYKDSGDPFDNGTTPVGYYDGSDHGGAFATNLDENSFGLFDMTGNVFEWMQDRFAAGNANPAIRGGSWNQTTGGLMSLMAAQRTFAAAAWSNPEIGFRVVRALPSPTGDSNGDGMIDTTDWGVMVSCFAGPAVDVPGSCSVFDVNVDGAIDAADFAEFQRLFSPGP